MPASGNDVDDNEPVFRDGGAGSTEVQLHTAKRAEAQIPTVVEVLISPTTCRRRCDPSPVMGCMAPPRPPT